MTSRADQYTSASRELLTRAQDSLAQNDLLQASEKGWGAAAQMVKAIAQRRGWPHNGHRELYQAAHRLAQETEDNEIRVQFNSASALHANFYENWMPLDQVNASLEQVRSFVQKLEAYLVETIAEFSLPFVTPRRRDNTMSLLPDVPLPGIYGEVIMAHHRNPHHRQPVDNADLEAQGFNPFCGDGIEIQIKLDETERVTRVCCQSQGCTIIQASASMMGDALEGKTLAEVETLSRTFHALMQGKLSEEEAAALGEMEALKAVRQYPVRIKCALLPWATLEEGIERFRTR